MDLVVHQVVEFQEVDIAYGNLVIKGLAGTSVIEDALAVGVQSGLRQHGLDVLLPGAVEDGGSHLTAQGVGGVAQVNLQHLADVHTAGNAQGVQHDVQRRAVGQEGHILLGQNPGHNALVSVPSGHLVAHLNLPALGDIDPDHHVYAGAQLVSPLPGEDLGVQHNAALAVGNLQGGVPDFPGLLAENGPEEALLGGEVRLTLGGDLAHQDVPGFHLRAHADNAVFIQVLHGVFAYVRNIPGDLLGTQLGVPGVDLKFFNVDGGVQVLPDQALVQKDGVLVVIALPGHEAHQNILAQGDLALLGGGAVRQDGGVGHLPVGADAPAMDSLAHLHNGPLVDAGGVVGAEELHQFVILGLSLVILDGDVPGVHRGDHAVALRQNHDFRVNTDFMLHAGTHNGGMGPQQGHGLTLHIRAHEGPVGVVVGKEGDHGGGDGNHHPGGNVDIVHHLPVHVHNLVPVPPGDTGVDQAAVFVYRLRSLPDDEVVFLVGGHIGDFRGNPASLLVHRPVGGLDKAVLVDPGVGGQVGDQADVGTFRRLDGAHTAIVAVVDVPDLHVGPLPGEAAGTQGGEAAFMRQLRQGVCLVHKLAQRAGAEELLDGGGDRTDIDQALRGDNVHVLNGHALPDDPLHAGKADAELILQQLAHTAQAAVPQVVDVVLDRDAPGQSVHIINRRENVVYDDVLGNQLVFMEENLINELLSAVLAQQLLEDAEPDPLLDLAGLEGVEIHIAAHVAHTVGSHPEGRAVHVNGHVTDTRGVQSPGVLLAQKVPLVEENLAGGGVRHRINQLAPRDPLPKRELLVELIPAHHGQVVPPGVEEQPGHQGLGRLHRRGLAGTETAVNLQHSVLVALAGVLFQGGHNPGIVPEAVQNLLVCFQTDGPKEAGDGNFPVFVDADPEKLVGVGLIFQPRAPLGNHLGGEDGEIRLDIHLVAVVHAGRADNLGDHDPLRAVDNEGAGVGHEGEIPHEDLLLLDLFRLLVPQADLHLQRRGVVGVPGLALFHVVLGFFVHLIVDEGQLQVALIVGNRAHVGKNLPQAGVQKLLIGGFLDLQEVGHGDDFLITGEVLAKGLPIILVFGHLHIHLSAAPRRRGWGHAGRRC